MGTEFDPFIAGLPFGAVIGLGPLLTPRLSGGLLVLVLLWMVFVLLNDGLPGLEAVSLRLIYEMAQHASMLFGLSAGAILSYSIARRLLKKDCGE